MALYHHGSEKYDVAASKAAANARTILEKLIDQGRGNAMSVIEKIQTEVPTDRVVKGPVLRFAGDADGLRVGINDDTMTVHRNALAQLSERGPVPLPAKLVGELQTAGAWGQELLAHNLNKIYANSKDRYLTRAYQGQMRGFLSNRFRRIDSRPQIEAFATACSKVGAIPVEGYGSDTRVALKAVLPMVFEPVPNEVLALGIMWANSDYGNGAHSIRAFMMRLWCTNYAITDECLREVHLGGRLTEDDIFSNRTYELDTKRSASMVRDVIEATLAPEKVNLLLDGVRAADAEKIDPKNTATFLKKHLGVGEAKQVVDSFVSADVENLPAGQSKWRLSNAISWIAGKQTDADKKIDMMKLAGTVLHDASVKWNLTA